MVITIASGKGGTGKTTIAINLAATLVDSEKIECHHSVWLLDCDVEEPNAALFLKPAFHIKKNVERPLPVIDPEKCSACGRCIEVCEYHAIAIVGKKPIFFKELCHACGSCTLNCPENAIDEKPEVIGILKSGKRGLLHFSEGLLKIGFSSPVPVIRELKKWVISSVEPHDIILLDASPGTTCPVVESLRDADFALLVTEPTPFGLHDLSLITSLVQEEFKLPCGVVINKSGTNDSIIENFCQDKGIPILMRLPLSRQIAEIYSKGNLLINKLPELKDLLSGLFIQIQNVKRG